MGERLSTENNLSNVSSERTENEESSFSLREREAFRRTKGGERGAIGYSPASLGECGNLLLLGHSPEIMRQKRTGVLGRISIVVRNSLRPIISVEAFAT